MGSFKDETASDWAARALIRMGQPAIPFLIKTLRSGDRELRQAAASILCEIGTVALPELLEATKDKDPEVRKAAAQAMEKAKRKSME